MRSNRSIPDCQVIPELAYPDVSRASAWLCNAFGFSERLRIANLALAEMIEGQNRGWGERDSRVPMLLQEERAGVSIKVPAEAVEAVLKRDNP